MRLFDFDLDGTGLFCGVLKYLLERGLSCPKTIASTHFHDVFHDDLINPYRVPITFVHMQVMISLSQDSGASREASAVVEDDDDGSDTLLRSADKIVYLYKYVRPFPLELRSIHQRSHRVVDGYTLHSHAITCAELSGVPKRVTSRAQYVQ